MKKISPLFYLPAVLAMKAIIQRGTAMHTLPLNSASLNNSNAALKTTAAILGGGVMTFAAFAFMQYLISAEQRADVKTGPDITVEIYEVNREVLYGMQILFGADVLQTSNWTGGLRFGARKIFHSEDEPQSDAEAISAQVNLRYNF